VNAARNAAARVDERYANSVMYGGATLDPALLDPLSKAYDGAVCLADRSTGEVLDLLKGIGIGAEDFVAVCGDHGENLGEHGELGHIFSLYEPVLHVPLVVRWPGRLEGGRREAAQVRLQDLYPTVLAAAGVEVPEACGKDARRLDEAPLEPRLLVAEYGPSLGFIDEARMTMPGAPEGVFERFHHEVLAVREPDGPGARKYLRFTRHAPGVAPALLREELYDLAADPGESTNLLEGKDPSARATADRLHALGR
jgi:arylsulfatase A-like enzyme